MTRSSNRGSSNAPSGSKGPAMKPSLPAWAASASALDTLNAPVQAAPPAPDAARSLLDQARALVCRLANQPLPHTCMLRLKIGFFFDGTGNNLDADIGTDEHSNVARLFNAFPKDRPEQGIYKHYIPGLGTYF